VASHTAGTDRAAAAGGLSRQRRVARVPMADGSSVLSHGMPPPPHGAGTGATCCGQGLSLGVLRLGMHEGLGMTAGGRASWRRCARSLRTEQTWTS